MEEDTYCGTCRADPCRVTSGEICCHMMAIYGYCEHDPFIRPGDYIRHKQYSHAIYRVLERRKLTPTSNWGYLLEVGEWVGPCHLWLGRFWYPEWSWDCEKWGMKLVKLPSH